MACDTNTFFAFWICLILSLIGAMVSGQDILLGRTVSLSGVSEATSKSLADGFDIWMKDVSTRGGILMQEADGNRHAVKLYSYNDASDPQVVDTQVENFVNTLKVHLVVGSYDSYLAESAAARANQTQTPTIHAASSFALFNGTFPNSFSVQTTLAKQQYACVSALANRTAKTAEVIVVNDTGMQLSRLQQQYHSAANVFSSVCSDMGISVTNVNSFASNEQHFVSVLQRWKSSPTLRPDVVFLSGSMDFVTNATHAILSVHTPKAILLADETVLTQLSRRSESAFAWEYQHLLRSSQWSASLNYTDEYYSTLQNFAEMHLNNRTNTNGQTASIVAAGYAMGYAIEKALETAASLNSTDIIAAFRGLDVVSSIWGPLRFSLATGELEAISLCEQLQQNAIVTVAPSALAAAQFIYPANPPRPPQPKYTTAEKRTIIGVCSAAGGFLLLFAAAMVLIYFVRTYHVLAFPKAEAEKTEWGT